MNEVEETQHLLFEVSLDAEQKAQILNRLYLHAQSMVLGEVHWNNVGKTSEEYKKAKDIAQYFLNVLEHEVRKR